MRVMDKRTVLTCFGLATAIVLAALASGCATDVNPPVIKQYKMPEWAVEDENIDLSVSTADDRGIKEIYVQFDFGDKISLTKVDSKKNGEEVANWEASFKLSPKDYSYSIVAKDTANESKKDGKIAVYPKDADGDGISYRYEIKYGLDPNKKNPISMYLLDNNLGVYIPVFTYLESDEAMDSNEKSFIDLVIEYHPEISQSLLGFYGEIAKLPDLRTIEEKDVEAIEDILVLAIKQEHKDAFESMLNEGIPDKRKYCSPLEALLWIAYDKEFDNPADNPLSNYSVNKLINDAWRNTTISQKYSSERWQYFEEVVDRLNSPQLVAAYCIDNFPYDFTKINDFIATGRPQPIWSPEETFTKKKGACMDQSTFVCYCLSEGGYNTDDFSINKDDGVCIFTAGPRDNPLMHFTCLYTEGGNFYVIDVGTELVRGIKGPLKTLEQAADVTFPRWGGYALFCTGETVIK